MAVSGTGNRAKVPADALKRCPSCGEPRGTKKAGWTSIVIDDAVVGFTCPDCPLWTEPIRREANRQGVRFLAVARLIGPDGKPRQAKRRFTVLDDARNWVEEIREGASEDASLLTVQTIADRWLAHREREVAHGVVRAVTVRGYKTALHSLLDLIGHRRARDLTPDDIEAALNRLAKEGGKTKRPLSHRSRTYALVALRMVYEYAIRQRWTLTNPARPAKVKGKPSKKPRRRWSVEEFQAFRAFVDDAYSDAQRLAAEPWVTVGMRLVLSGLRRSEALGLRWENVNRDAGAVTIAASRTAFGEGAPKTENAARTVAVEELNPGTKKALKALHLQQGMPTEGLVLRDSLGAPVHPDTFSWRFRSLCTEAGVPFPGSMHNTRHTLATALKEAGIPDNQGAALLGHDVHTYRRFYVLTDDEAAAEGAKAAGAIFNPPAAAAPGG